MVKTYLVRAKVEGPFLKVPSQLPASFKEFTLDYSPHYKLVQMREFGLEPQDVGFDPENVPSPDNDYPFSLLYIDAEIQVKKPKEQYRVADETLEQLEASFRVFKEGDIRIRRHKMWRLKGQSWAPDYGWLFLFQGTREYGEFRVKPEPIPLYERKEYELDDETFVKFRQFMDSYWDIILGKPMPLYVAMLRFSSSYEKRTLADRLIQLMIAMEALFGDIVELTYKISLRSACLLYPPGEARERAFETIKDFYGERSNIIHGKKLATKFSDDRISQFEGYVRSSIVKFLQLYKEGHPISLVKLDKWGKELDKLLFFTGSKNDQA